MLGDHDLHNHTIWSDGVLTPGEVVQAAGDAGIGLVGITDHFATPKVHSIRPDALDRYRQELESLRKEGSPRVACGLEIDGRTLLTGMGWLPLQALRRLDYVLVEHAGAAGWGRLPLAAVLRLGDLLEMPVGLAHTDMAAEFGSFPPDVLARQLAEHRVFVELNPRYHRGGEKEPYFRHAAALLPVLAEAGVLFSLGSDGHDGRQEVGAVAGCASFARELELPLLAPEHLGLD